MNKKNTREVVDIPGKVKMQTSRAYLFFDGTLEAWVPKSQCQWDEDAKTMTMTMFVAEDKGFI